MIGSVTSQFIICIGKRLLAYAHTTEYHHSSMVTTFLYEEMLP